MKNLFDDVERCIRSESSAQGTVFVRRKDLAEFSADVEKEPVQSVPAVSSVSSVSPMEQLFREALACRACRLAETRRNVVFSDGSEKTDLMFIGEGPGADEDAQGIPFVGRAGQLLTKMISAMHYDRSAVYIANIVKCRPPGNRNPEPDEAGACIHFLERQIELVHPKVIVLLGAVPLRFLMNRTGIMRMRGQWLDYHGIAVMPTFHPAYLLRNPAAKADAWHDLQLVMAKLGIPVR